VDEHYSEELTLQRVADAAGISPGYLSTSFPQVCGKGFIDYLNQVRIEHACAYLKQKYFKTYEIAYKVGFKDEKYFTRVFKKLMGMTPNEYKKSN
ncbi:helix-turn-helix domain-containing protein, partial [Parabacteroides distasonis]